MSPGVSFFYTPSDDIALLEIPPEDAKYYVRYPIEIRRQLYTLYKGVRQGTLAAWDKNDREALNIVMKIADPLGCRVTIGAQYQQLTEQHFKPSMRKIFKQYYGKKPSVEHVSTVLEEIFDHARVYPSGVIRSNYLHIVRPALERIERVMNDEPIRHEGFLGKDVYLITTISQASVDRPTDQGVLQSV